MPVTSFVPCKVWDFTELPSPKEVQAPAPADGAFVPDPVYDFTQTRGPTRAELRTELRMIRRHRKRLRKVLKMIPADEPERSAFERAVGRVIGRRWAESPGSRGRKPDAQRAEKVRFARELKARHPDLIWDQIAERVNARFGTEYTGQTVRRYVAAERQKKKLPVAA